MVTKKPRGFNLHSKIFGNILYQRIPTGLRFFFNAFLPKKGTVYPHILFLKALYPLKSDLPNQDEPQKSLPLWVRANPFCFQGTENGQEKSSLKGVLFSLKAN